MTTAFVLGNGVSRQCIDPAALKTVGQVYGCNALYRTFAPDALISTDTPISEAVQRSGYSEKYVHYTRKPITGLGSLKIPQDYYGYSSGPVAVALAAAAAHSRIYLLGFDMGPDQTGKFNNLYADTEFYKKSSAAPTYTGNWIQQIRIIADKFEQTTFIRVTGKTTAEIKQFDPVKNLEHMQLAEFVDRINNKKDL
jgi:hypothetical protein